MQDESLPGAQLRRAREEKGISREEVSRGLHLSRNYLIALENDEYSKLPEPAFIKGYLRNYARLLGLPGEEVAALYQQRLDRERVSAEEHQAETNERRRGASPRWRLPALIVLVIILVLLVGWWLWPGHEAGQSISQDSHQIESGQVENGQSENMTPPSAAANEVGASAATLSQDAPDSASASAQEGAPAAADAGGSGEANGGASALTTGADSSMASGVTDEGAGADNGTTGTNVATDSNDSAAGDELSAQSTVTAPAEAAVASTDQGSEAAPAAIESGSLAMAFSRLCWIKVVDGTDKTLAVGTQQAGTTVDLKGEAPFRVTIGDAGAVSSVVVNGEQASLPSQQSGEVIHVTLP